MWRRWTLLNKIFKRLFSLVFALTLFISPIWGLSIPKQDTSIYVNDYSEVLSTSCEEELIRINQDSDYAYGGYVVVATFDFVEEDLYDFSYRLFNAWGIGHEEYDNGVLLVLDIGNDNYCYILGSGIEKILSDGEARSIIDTYMEPYFAQKDYDNAVLETTKQFLKVIEEEDSYIIDDYYNDEYYDDEYYYMDSFADTFIQFFFSIMVVLIIFVCVIIAITGRRRRYGGIYVPLRHRRHTPPPYGRHHDPHRGFKGPSHHSSSRGFTGSSRPSGGSRSSSGGFRSSGGGRSGGSHHSGGSSRGGGGTRR